MNKIEQTQKKSVNIASFRQLGLVIFMLILIVIVQLRNPTFLTLENINDLLKNTAILSILAVGMMMVLLTGGIDLSIGSTLALSGMICGITVFQNPEMPIWLLILLAMLVGTVCGFVVGSLVSWGKIIPIIASLGMMNVFRGLTYMISGGKWISAYQMSEGFKQLATGSVLGINNLILMAVVIYILYYYFINLTRTGRQIYAVGSNAQSAEITGINKNKVLILVYTLMGMLSGLAGILWVSKFASAQGDTATGYELNVIASCVLGGVSVSGGVGKVSGLLLGTLMFGILQNALPLINVSPFWQQCIQGFVILIAILVNVGVKRQVDRNNLRRRKI